MKSITQFSYVLLTLIVCLNVAGQNRSNDILSDTAKLAEFVYINTHYPLMDYINNVEGTSVYQIDTDNIGRIDELQLITSSGSSMLDSEARRLIHEIPMEQRKSLASHKISIKFKLTDNRIYNINELEEKPEFEGGDTELKNFIFKNLQYPPEAIDSSISGRIFCGFVVEKDGTINIVEIVRSLYHVVDAEVMRVVKRMPKWEAGKKDGKPVRVYYVIPVKISL